MLRYRRSISKLSLILSGPAHAGLLKAIAGCSLVVYSHGSVFNRNSELDAGHQKSGHLRGVDSRRGPGGACRWGCLRGGGGALRRALARCGSGVGRGRRCDPQVHAKSQPLRWSSIKPCSISINRISHHRLRWRRFQSLWSMSWVIFVPHP